MKVVSFLEIKRRALSRGKRAGKGVCMACVVLVSLSACQTTSGTGGGTSSSVQNVQDMTAAHKTLLSAGREAEIEHKYEMAANAYGRLYEKRPNDSIVLASFIRTMRYSGKSREIVAYVEANTQHLLKNPSVKFEYGKALITAGKKAKALSVLQDVSTKIRDNWDVFSAMGIAYDALGNFPKAVQMYTQALQLSPGNVVVLNNMAMSEAMNGQLAAAILTLEKAANLDRNNSHVRQNLALLYAVRGDVNKAKALASMDLSSGDLETNLTFYQRFGGRGLE
ncbi:MAG: hypothetical protein COB59_05170 [Rhodospirillaceae bacterium]|nr:MAG: hypothetical protein COB59_05170 [Rhodospirillaceae bacterium]